MVAKAMRMLDAMDYQEFWQFALKEEPHYIIEVISENFDKLDEKSKKIVILHELLHIPKKFSGGLVFHTKWYKKKLREFTSKLD